jgi:hypothetical protein
MYINTINATMITAAMATMETVDAATITPAVLTPPMDPKRRPMRTPRGLATRRTAGTSARCDDCGTLANRGFRRALGARSPPIAGAR